MNIDGDDDDDIMMPEGPPPDDDDDDIPLPEGPPPGAPDIPSEYSPCDRSYSEDTNYVLQLCRCFLHLHRRRFPMCTKTCNTLQSRSLYRYMPLRSVLLCPSYHHRRRHFLLPLEVVRALDQWGRVPPLAQRSLGLQLQPRPQL
jgi:hypothetical protein